MACDFHMDSSVWTIYSMWWHMGRPGLSGPALVSFGIDGCFPDDQYGYAWLRH